MQDKHGGDKTLIQTAQAVYEQRGFMGFYSGVVPRLARVILDAALTFSIFHSLKRNVIAALEKRNAEKK
jgi:hypothetical protein